MDARFKTLLDKDMSRKEFLTFSSLTLVSLFGVGRVIKEMVSHATTSNGTVKADATTNSPTAAVAMKTAIPGNKTSTPATLAATTTMVSAGTGIPVIFDTDMSSDYDDVGDYAVLSGLAQLGECQIIGAMVDSTNGATALCLNAINTYYGTPNIPIGVRPDVGGNGAYPAQIASEFPHALQSSANCPLAATLYRQLLAGQPDNSVVIVTAGFLDNLYALMQTGPDQYSSLTGTALIAQKVKLLACAGGGYPSGGEFNFTVSPTAAQYVINNWPTAATFSPDNVGRYYYTGRTLVQTPNNPTRRVYVDIESNTTGYPSWTQVVILQAIRGNTGLFALNNTGSNTVAGNGTNQWVASPDPSGSLDQAYIIERARIPVTDSLNALMTILPASIASNVNVPGAPSDLKATVVNTSQINLSWVKNSYNETSFVIEQQTSAASFTQTGSVGSAGYTQIGSVGAGVTSFSITGLSKTSNLGFRVKAVNGAGSSYVYSYVWVYSGWTEYNFSYPGQNLPLYTYYQTCDLRWGKGGDYSVNHVSINNDSSHGPNLTVNVLATAQGAQGGMFIYFFYQDQNNWYRLNFDNGGEVINDTNNNKCWFEKNVAGTVTQIGSKVATTNYQIGNGSQLSPWSVAVTSAGNLTFLINGTQLLSVNDTMSFAAGSVGLGGSGMTPVWENFNFSTSGGSAGTAPSAPTALTASAGTGQVALTWTAVSTATGYNVYRGTSAAGESTIAIATGLTSAGYTDTTVASGTRYYYTVASSNTFGTSSFSTEVSATPIAAGSPPTVVTNVVANAGTTQVALTWTAVSTATGYNVYRGTSAAGESTTAIASGLTSPNYTDTGLTGGTKYYYTLKATNSYGTSVASAETSAVPAPAGTGGSGPVFLNPSFEIPTVGGYSYSPAGSSWTFTNQAGIQQNGSGYSYSQLVAPDGIQTAFLQGTGGTLGTMSQNVTFPAGTYTLSFYASQRYTQVQPIRISIDGSSIGTYTPPTSNFTQMTTASFTVTAGAHTVLFAATTSSGDTTTFIDLVTINTTSTTPTPPSAPTGLTATPGPTQVALTWTAVSGATGYNVYRGTSAGAESTTAIVTGITSASYTDTGLAGGTKYYYTVAASNANGISASSTEASATPTVAGTAPSAPSGVAATAGTTQVSLSWTSTSGASSYSVYRGTSAGAESTTAIASGLSSTAYTDTGLTGGTKYYYVIKASNSFGTSAASTEVSATPTVAGTAPTAATNLVATGGTKQVALTWTAVSGATGYNVYRGTSAGAENTTAIVTGITSANYTDTGLTGGTQYYYVVRATNGFGISASSTEASATPTVAGTAPSVPTGFAAAAGTSQVALSWTATATATGYNVYRGTSAGAESTTAIATAITTTNYTDTGITSGMTYFYTLKATNSFGTSPNSAEVSATPASVGATPVFVNPSFETPYANGYTYNPAGAGWTFTNNAGIQQNGSGYSYSQLVAPDGTQTAFLQGTGGTLGTMSQTVTFPAGTYTLSFYASQRYGQVQPVQIKVDSTVIGTYTPPTSNFTQMTTASFTVTAGSHTISFAATTSSGDTTTFIDLVTIGH